MNQGKISVRYAKALFLSAIDNKNIDTIYNDMQLVFTICKTSSDFVRLLESPIIYPSEKSKVITTIFKNKINELTLNFLQLITKNGRENFLTDIARNFIDNYRKYKGIRLALLTTAIVVDQAFIEKIKSIVETALKSKIEIKYHTDEKIIGGFVLQVEDKQIDASIATQLKKIERSLINKTI